jgi:cysteine-rich repeat protein
MRLHLVRVLGLGATLVIGTALPVAAQLQSSQQRACLAAFDEAASKLAKAQVRELMPCAQRLIESGGSPASCLVSDPHGRIQAARERLSETVASKCAIAPDFGMATSATAIAAATAEAIAVYWQIYRYSGGLPSLGFASDATCVKQSNRLFAKTLATKLRAFFDCKRIGVTDGSITSAVGLTGCLAQTEAAQNEKIARLRAKVAARAGKLCSLGGPLFSCFESDPAAFAQCIDRVIGCRTCRLLQAIDGLSVDCDVLDDAAANGSCPGACGNGVVEAGYFAIAEDCDDGNVISGDGCDYDCTVSACGNGVTAGDEYCDGFGGRCIGGQDDGAPCHENAECPGGNCTSCPSGNCAGNCGSCGAGWCCDILGCAYYEGYGQGCHAAGGTAVSCSSATCQYAGLCCASAFLGCQDGIDALACASLGGTLGPCSECPTCCAFDGYCTSWSDSTCREYEGTPVDCSQCWTDTP